MSLAWCLRLPCPVDCVSDVCLEGDVPCLPSLVYQLCFPKFTAAGAVLCGGRKTSPRTSTIVQFLFYFWPFQISVNILRNQK